MSFLKRAADALLTLYREYPARANALIVAGAVALCSAVGIVVAPQSVETILGVVIPILITGEATHHRVTPVG
jgi:hypothetical protein